jgi:hypothetical protein
MRKFVVVIAAASAAMAAALTMGGGVEPLTCDRNAANGTQLATQYAAATAGQTVCLTASTDYGTLTTNATKTGANVTITAADNVDATLAVYFNPATNTTIDGTASGGTITMDGADCCNESYVLAGSKSLEFKHLTFTAPLHLEKDNAGTILVDHGTFWNIAFVNTSPARLTIWGTGQGVTVQNSLFGGPNGDADGIRTDGGDVVIQDNEFTQFRDLGDPFNHNDPIQQCCSDPSPSGNIIRRNYFHDNGSPTGTPDNKGISSYIMQADGGSNSVVEDNVFAGGSHAWVGGNLTWNSDTGSNIRHNTFEYSATGCGVSDSTPAWNSGCGGISLDRKLTDDAGSGTVIRDNIITEVGTANGSAFTADHNMSPLAAITGATNFTGTPVYVGGTHPTTYEGYCLAPGSPGKGAASDGLDVGMRC